ncbi:MAG: hypothetical protein JWL98_891 [Xanthomonadaceae bacterium]|nr:hypothetical protein [Xanthomonadaceae bacterium]
MERTQIEETLAMLQAQATVQHMVLRTLMRAMPNPSALLTAWREIRCDAAAAASLLPADARHSDWIAEQIESFAEEWTAEFADLAIAVNQPTTPHGDRNASASGGS